MWVSGPKEVVAVGTERDGDGFERRRIGSSWRAGVGVVDGPKVVTMMGKWGVMP